MSLSPSPLPPITCDRVGAADDGVELRHFREATSSDQRLPRDKLVASSILSGGTRRGSSFLKPPRNLGVGTKTVMPRRSASARSGRKSSTERVDTPCT